MAASALAYNLGSHLARPARGVEDKKGTYPITSFAISRRGHDSIVRRQRRLRIEAKGRILSGIPMAVVQEGKVSMSGLGRSDPSRRRGDWFGHLLPFSRMWYYRGRWRDVSTGAASRARPAPALEIPRRLSPTCTSPTRPRPKAPTTARPGAVGRRPTELSDLHLHATRSRFSI
jgi:hypothetical protein